MNNTNHIEIFSPKLCAVVPIKHVNKKKALETACILFNKYDMELKTQALLEGFIQRERLGATAIGHQVAIPHSRHPDINRPLCAVICFAHPVDFDPPHEQPVRILFALIAPEHHEEQHAPLLARLVTPLKQTLNRQALLDCRCENTLYQTVQNLYAHPHHDSR